MSSPAGYVRRMNLGPLMLLAVAMLLFQPWLAMRGMFPAPARTALDVATVVAVALLLAVRRPRVTLDAIHPSVRPWFVVALVAGLAFGIAGMVRWLSGAAS